MSAKGSGKPCPHAVCPNDLALRHGLVVCGLGEELSEIEIRTQSRRIEVGFPGFVKALVGIKLEVSRVSHISSRQSREAYMAIGSWY